MDHMYAATTSLTGADVEITPPPATSSYITDHKFAHPPSECPEVDFTSHTESQSPKTNSASKTGQLVQTKAAAGQTRKEANKLNKTSESEAAIKQDQCSERRGSDKHSKPSESKGAAKQELQAKTSRRLSSRQDQSMEAASTSKEEQSTKQSAVKQDLKKSPHLANKQVHSKETGRMMPRQDLSKKTAVVNIKSEQSQLARKVNSNHVDTKNAGKLDTCHNQTKVTEMPDSKQDQIKKTEESSTEQDQVLETRKTVSRQQAPTKETREMATRNESPEKVRAASQQDTVKRTRSSDAILDHETLEKKRKVSDEGGNGLGTGDVIAKQFVSEEIRRLSNDKDTNVEKHITVSGKKSGQLRKLLEAKAESDSEKSSLKVEQEEKGENPVAAATLSSIPSIPDSISLSERDGSSVDPVFTESTGDGGCLSDCVTSVSADSPSVEQGETNKKKEQISSHGSASSRHSSSIKVVDSVCAQGEKGEHASDGVDRAPSAETRSQALAEATGPGDSKNVPCSVTTANMEIVEIPDRHKKADTGDSYDSIAQQKKHSCRRSGEEGRTAGSEHMWSRHLHSESVNEESNNSSGTPALDEGKSLPSAQHSVSHISAELVVDKESSESSYDGDNRVDIHSKSGSHDCGRSDESGGDAKTSEGDILKSTGENRKDSYRQTETECKQARSMDGGCVKNSSAEADGDKNKQIDNSESIKKISLDNCGSSMDIADSTALKTDTSGSSGQNVDKADTDTPATDRQSLVCEEASDSQPQPSDSDLGSGSPHNIGAVVEMKTKVPEGEEDTGTISRKRTAAETNLDATGSSSDLFLSSQSSDVTPDSLMSFHSPTTSASKPAVHSKPQKNANVPHADSDNLEMYKIPLRDYGWKREIVVRGVYAEDKCKMPPADVYYFTPDGRKLRSGVKIAAYLSETSSPLTPEHFTFMKKTIWKEPREVVRQAGKPGVNVSNKKKTSTASCPKTDSPPAKMAKVKITPKSLNSSSTSASSSVSGSTSKPPRFRVKPAYLSSMQEDFSDSSESDLGDDDNDYNPSKESVSPEWNKRRTIFGHRNKRGHMPKRKPEREVLIQSMPEPEIIIDRADESLYAPDDSSDKGDNLDTSMHRMSNIPRMMLLPSDMKYESDDSGEWSGGSLRNVSSVHIYTSPVKPVKVNTKSTARKSTMPWNTFKKPRHHNSNGTSNIKPRNMSRPREKSKCIDLPPVMGGQLCSSACPGMNGVAPSLQCCVCMCLFHHKCVNISPSFSLQIGFKCLRCRYLVASEHSPVFRLSNSTNLFSSPSTSTIITTPTIQITANNIIPSTAITSSIPTYSSVKPPGPRMKPPGPRMKPPGPRMKFPGLWVKPPGPQMKPPGPQVKPPGPRMKPPGPQVMPQGPRVIVVQGPLGRTSMVAVSTPMPTLPTPLITNVPTSLVPVQQNMNASQLLRSLTPLVQQTQPMLGGPTPIPVRHAPPVVPPQLIRGGSTQDLFMVPQFQSRPMPPLIAAPGVAVPISSASVSPFAPPVVSLAVSAMSSAPGQPHVLTLPASLLSRLNLTQPLTVKMNNSQVVIPSSCLLAAKEGIKVLLPPSIFSMAPDSNARLNICVPNTLLATAAPVTSPALTSITTSLPGGSTGAVALTLTSQRSGDNVMSARTVGDTSGPTAVSVVNSMPSEGANIVSSWYNLTSAGAVPFPKTEPPIATVLHTDQNIDDSGNNLSSSSISPALLPSTKVEVDVEDGGGVRCGSRRRTKRRGGSVDVTQCMIHRLHGGFDCMLEIFRYLSVPDLLRAGQVCRTWQKIAQEKCLWRKVSLEGLQIKDWDRAALFLNYVKIHSLNLQKVQPESQMEAELEQFWEGLRNCVNSLSELRCLELGLVPAHVLHSIADTLMDLTSLTAQHITDFTHEEKWTSVTKLDVGRFGMLTELRELRLRGVSSLALPSFSFSGSLSELTSLKHLHTLSLTSMSAMRDIEFTFLADMRQLRVLEMGECLQWTEETYNRLGELTNLEHLRLESGGWIPDCGLGGALARLKKLERLELILFAIPASLVTGLSQLPLLRTLVVWPHAYHTLNLALVNSHALMAVVGLQQLSCLEWGMVTKPIQQNTSAPQASACPMISISLMRPGATLDPEADISDQDIMDMSINDFTHKLLTSMPHTTTIRVFNTQLVGRESS